MGWTRAEHARRLWDEGPFDVVLIGGGITGAGSALDLAARGLHVAVVEQADFAAGTSSRSTKLLHGGVRYLPQLHLRLVAEGLREQAVLARIADHLFEPLEFVVPVYDQHGFASVPRWLSRGRRADALLRLGLTAYDLLGGRDRPGARHRRMDRAAVQAAVPRLRVDGLRGGYAYSDAQTRDARLVVSVAATAVAHGAVALNGIRVDTVEPAGDRWAVRVTDGTTGDGHVVTARAVLAATGAFAAPSAGTAARGQPLVLSRGTHLVVPASAVGLDGRAVVLPETDDRRVLYVVPWLGHALVGTTDVAFGDDPAHPRASDEEVAYLLRHVARYLDVGDLQPVSTFAGLRALAAHGGASTRRASREHVVRELAPGYVTVAGGKLTTYRRIAAEAADLVARHLGCATPSPTEEIPLRGSWRAAGTTRSEVDRALAASGVDGASAVAVRARLGAAAATVAELCRAQPALAAPTGAGVVAEAVHAVRHEGATALADVTLRRSELAWTTADHARAAAPALAAAMGTELGWDDAERAGHLAAHETALAQEGL
jgi:glycerol-3-phosphate dehydrogenase